MSAQNLPRSARRIVIDRPGGYDALQLREVPLSEPGPGEVLIDVEACGVNYADGIIRMGLYASAKALHGYPITPGFELAGRIAALGAGVESLTIGQRVIGVTLFGGYTSAIVLKADRVFPCPDRLDTVAAAGIPTVFLTAWFMVHEQVHPRAGERWLVHSAAGGVGMALCQLGRLAGVEVTGVVGAAGKVDAARAAGAAHVIDKSREDWRAAARRIVPQGYDAIYDANGVSTLGASWDLLAPMGKLVIYGFASMLPRDGRVNWLKLAWDWMRTPRFNPLAMTQTNRSVFACNLSFLSAHAERLAEGMRWLLARFEASELEALPVSSYPLEQAAAAQRSIESGSTSGKLVLLPGRGNCASRQHPTG
jgi:NADPH:quinone reductase-like Zn-dependent oxidoreductase